MNIRGVAINWKYVKEDDYVRNIETLRSMEPLMFHSPVTFFAGENGTGKSTLLEAIATAYGFNAEGGSMNYSFSTYDSHSDLSHALTVIKDPYAEKYGYFLRAESFYNVATEEMNYSDILHPSMKLHEKSHGESFLAIMEKYMDNSGMFILDEPEAALSQQRQMTLSRSPQLDLLPSQQRAGVHPDDAAAGRQRLDLAILQVPVIGVYPPGV